MRDRSWASTAFWSAFLSSVSWYFCKDKSHDAPFRWQSQLIWNHVTKIRVLSAHLFLCIKDFSLLVTGLPQLLLLKIGIVKIFGDLHARDVNFGFGGDDKLLVSSAQGDSVQSKRAWRKKNKKNLSTLNNVSYSYWRWCLCIHFHHQHFTHQWQAGDHWQAASETPHARVKKKKIQLTVSQKLHSPVYVQVQHWNTFYIYFTNGLNNSFFSKFFEHKNINPDISILVSGKNSLHNKVCGQTVHTSIELYNISE